MKQAGKFLNSGGRKIYVPLRIQLIAVPNLDLLKVAHHDFVPPFVLLLPFESEMSPAGHSLLCDEIYIKLKGIVLTLEKIRFLSGANQ